MLRKARGDLTGERFGKLVVIEKAPAEFDYIIPATGKHVYKWKCKCDCGNIKYITDNQLRYGYTKSCGCLRKDLLKEKSKTKKNKQDVELQGQKFGLLTVIEDGLYRTNSQGAKIKQCKCRCECGNEVYVNVYHLLDGHTKSCGCTRKDNFKYITHGMSKEQLYIRYIGIKNRCYLPSNREYKNYGGRGIKICDEWLGENGYLNFKEWAISHGYTPELTIDRIDNNKGYSPDNCRWVSYKEQGRNKSNNLFITYNNETHPLCEWVEILGISWGKIRYRYYHNEDLLTGDKLNEKAC